MNRKGAGIPVDLKIVFAEHARIDRLAVLLPNAEALQPFGCRANTRCFDQRHGVDHQLRRDLAEPFTKHCGVVAQTNRQLTFQQNRPRVQPLLHRHHPNPGFGIAFEQGPLDRCGTTPARQQRAMAVPAPQWRLFQHGQRQNLAEGNNNADVRIEGRQLLLAGLIPPDPLRREHGNSQLERPLLHS